jgi:hypothetical protein
VTPFASRNPIHSASNQHDAEREQELEQVGGADVARGGLELAIGVERRADARDLARLENGISTFTTTGARDLAASQR